MSRSIYYFLKEKTRVFVRSLFFQKYWESLFRKSLMGMNYWGASLYSESGELLIIERLLAEKENVIFFDVGANDGHYALEVARLLKDSATIHSFEPLSSMYATLCETTVNVPNIVRHNFGLGSEEADLPIYFSKEVSVLTSLYDNVPNRELNENESVHIKTLDGFVATNGISNISYIKIDVEGHELKVLEGASKCIKAGMIDFIQFEFGETMIDSRTFFRDFWNLLSEQYKIYRMLPKGLREIDQYSQNLEIFNCVNYLAINRSNPVRDVIFK